MVIVNAPMKRNEIKELVAAEFPGVKLVSEVGMKISFESIEGSDEDNAAAIKAAIKKTEYGSALFFQVTVG